MDSAWFMRLDYYDPHISQTDFRVAHRYRRKLRRTRLLAQALAEYFKIQRLHPHEINQWEQHLKSSHPLAKDFASKVRLALAEGVLKDDLLTVDEDTFIGTVGQLLFQWVRSEYYDEIICAYPMIQTDSSKRQGIDRFEILGDSKHLNSLYFIVWEVKATDHDVSSRVDEIYRMHRSRSARLMRGLEMQLSLEFPVEQYPVLGIFVRQLLDHWINNTPSKRIGGAVIHDTSNTPTEVFTTFHERFHELHSHLCRQVLLIEIPRFRKTRRELWKYLRAQMS